MAGQDDDLADIAGEAQPVVVHERHLNAQVALVGQAQEIIFLLALDLDAQQTLGRVRFAVGLGNLPSAIIRIGGREIGGLCDARQ